MFKVSNRNTRKRCLLISKITLKTSERRHLTTSYLPEVTVQNHVLDSFSQNIYQFAIKSLVSVLLSSLTARNFNQQTHICHFMRNEKSLPTYLIHENSKCQHFFIYENKTAPKTGRFFNFLQYLKGQHFSITKSAILIFCNILHLEMDF